MIIFLVLIKGWMLRVAPMRIPIAKYSNGWEEYQNLNSTDYNATDQANERVFYFNRNTYEATYDIPEDIRYHQSTIHTIIR